MREKMNLTHIDEQGNACMVDVSPKAETARRAVAKGSIYMSRECFALVKAKALEKGDVLGVARIAGIMGAKRCAELIPLCHPLNLTKVSVDFEMQSEAQAEARSEAQTEVCRIIATCEAKTTGKTGVEMEALTGVNIALLTIYDMCKAVDKNMEMGNIYLEEKDGGKSGHFHHKKRK